MKLLIWKKECFFPLFCPNLMQTMSLTFKAAILRRVLITFCTTSFCYALMLKYLNEFYNLITYFLQLRIFNLRYVWKKKRYKDLGNIL